MATITERFESIAEDPILSENQAIRSLVDICKEQQSTIDKLKADKIPSKLDRLLELYISRCKDWDPIGVVIGHVLMIGVIIGALWLIGLLSTYLTHNYVRELGSRKNTEYTPGYLMTGFDNVSGSGACWKIQFMGKDGTLTQTSPCLMNRDDAVNTLTKLQELLQQNDKFQTELGKSISKENQSKQQDNGRPLSP